MSNVCVPYMDVGEGREQDAVSFMKLSNSSAKAGSMSEASALGLAYVSCLDLAHFESQAGLPRINQRCLKYMPTAIAAIKVQRGSR
jgi:hypothetical protein